MIDGCGKKGKLRIAQITTPAPIVTFSKPLFASEFARSITSARPPISSIVKVARLVGFVVRLEILPSCFGIGPVSFKAAILNLVAILRIVFLRVCLKVILILAAIFPKLYQQFVALAHVACVLPPSNSFFVVFTVRLSRLVDSARVLLAIRFSVRLVTGGLLPFALFRANPFLVFLLVQFFLPRNLNRIKCAINPSTLFARALKAVFRFCQTSKAVTQNKVLALVAPFKAVVCSKILISQGMFSDDENVPWLGSLGVHAPRRAVSILA
jgi:hypothetical protein